MSEKGKKNGSIAYHEEWNKNNPIHANNPTRIMKSTKTSFFMRRSIEQELLLHLYLTSMLSKTHTRPFQKLTPKLVSKAKVPKNLIYAYVCIQTIAFMEKNGRNTRAAKTYQQNISDLSPILQINSWYFDNISIPNYNMNNLVSF